MNAFTLVIDYLTGYAVATDPASRERAEWPPHPARVFMALAAAHFETQPENAAQRDALEWLAALPPPELAVPAGTDRDVLTVYVPVNDQNGPDALLARSRQPRTFPRVHVGDEPLRLTWRFDSASDVRHLDGLEAVCRQVTRIGHSSSLVWVRLEREAAVQPTHRPDAAGLGTRLRTPFATMLRLLREDYGQDDRDTYERLQTEISQLEAERKQAKGKAAGERKREIDDQLASKRTDLQTRYRDGPPAPVRPRVSHASSYVQVAPAPGTAALSPFDPNFIVLRESDRSTRTFGLESTAQMIQAMVGLLLSHLRDRNEQIPPWISGHEPNGDPLRSQPHIAIFPLAFVGGEHGDGHLMGLGIAIPAVVPLRERSKVFAPLLFDAVHGEPVTLKLYLGRAGEWLVERETSFTPKQTLRPSTYTAPSRSWVTVTPIALDRMPKKDRSKDPAGWREEIAGIIATSCERVGLPAPVCVRVEKTPFFRGSLRAMPGQGGFPQLRPDRFQVHAQITFAQDVAGPVLLGAGRFRGYGLLRPWHVGEEQ